MTKALCYYEILGVSETASGDEIKRAYKTQALVWHPDKNQANPEEAHAKFQTILKAYETLSDSKEREWYDRHKDQILSGGDPDQAEQTVNLFQYFSSACYANFDDSEDGFYTVYRQVFDQLAQEELQAIQLAARLSKGKNKLKSDSSSESLPAFGNSDSDYDQVVRPFYAYWSGFCTQLTFDHLDKYNTTEAENRRISRLMEKENKKVKDGARKERNANVRNLVEFIKKRDRRLKAHKLLVDQQNELNRQKTLEKQRQQREKSQQQSSEYKPSAWLDMNDVEAQLQQLESEYDNHDLKKARKGRQLLAESSSEEEEEHVAGIEDEEGVESEPLEANGSPGRDAKCTRGKRLEARERVGGLEGPSDIENAESEEEEEEKYFCPACNKDFKSINAFENHEVSKKHKQNVQKLTKLLKADEIRLNK